MKERMEWIDRINRGDFDHENVLVLDECSVGTNASRRVRGYGPVGHRVRHYDLFGKTHNGTLMAACNSDGFVLAACEFINETMDTDRCVSTLRSVWWKVKSWEIKFEEIRIPS
jgi:hypothetical protein